MKGKHLYQLVIATLMLFSSQHVVSQPIKPAVEFTRALLNFRELSTPILRGGYDRFITGMAARYCIEAERTVMVQTSGVMPINGEIDPRLKIDEIALPGKNHRNDRPYTLPTSRVLDDLDDILNSTRSISVWPDPLLRVLVRSIIKNPPLPLYGKWRIIGLESNDPQLKSEYIALYHTSILKNEYINISKDTISYFSCGQTILSIDVQPDYINSFDNETPEITWLDKNAISIDVHFGNRSKGLVLHRVTEDIPSPIGHTVTDYNTTSKISPVSINSPLHKVEADTQIDDNLRDTNIELSTISAPKNDINWWDNYIQNLIEDQMIQQGKEEREKLIDNKRVNQPNDLDKLFQLIPIRHDVKQEGKRNTSYIIYTYGYELAA